MFLPCFKILEIGGGGAWGTGYLKMRPRSPPLSRVRSMYLPEKSLVKERGLPSRTAAGNQACLKTTVAELTLIITEEEVG